MKKLFAVILIFYVSWIFSYTQTNPAEAECKSIKITGSKVICVGEVLTLVATTEPVGCPVTWGTSPKGEPATETAKQIFKTKWAAAGKKIVTATCGEKTDSYEVCVIEKVEEAIDVDKVTYPLFEVKEVPANAWGVTDSDPDVHIVLKCYFDCNTNVWKCRVTEASYAIGSKSRLLPGVVEVTKELVQKTLDCTKLTTMVKSLTDVANQKPDSGFYMLAAVQNHEKLHVTKETSDITASFKVFKKEVEVISIAEDCSTLTAERALEKLKNTVAYISADTDFLIAQVESLMDSSDHEPIASYIAAEVAIVNPMIKIIQDRKMALNCP